MFSQLADKDKDVSTDLVIKELNKENAKVRIALIGVGAVAAFHHIPGIRIDPRAKLVAICDPAEQLLHQRQKEWGIPKAVTNYEEIANDPNIDAVIIATPNNTHVPIATACIKNGKHVMCEKPLGVSAEEAVKLWQVAEAQGVVHMTALTYRFAPSMKFLKQLIDEGKLGQLRHFRSQRFLDWPETSWSWRQYKATAGAGNIYDMSIHRLDFAQYLMGTVKSVSGYVKQFVSREKTPQGDSCKPSEVDDWTGILAEFESGATGVFEGSTLMKGHHNNGFGFEWAEVNGSEGSAVYQLKDPNFLLFGKHGQSLERVPVPKELLVLGDSPRKPDEGEASTVFRYDQLYEFVSAICEKRAARPSFKDGAIAQLVADAAIRSSQERRWVDVPHLSLTPTAAVAPLFHSLAGKVAVITGGGTGIGKASALRLAGAGARVFILGRRVEPLKEVEEEFRKKGTGGSCGGSISSVACDVADPAAVETAFKAIVTALSSVDQSNTAPSSAPTSKNIDILVNSAGLNVAARQASILSIADYRKVMSANVDGAFYCIHESLPGMRKQKCGLIINISSVAALRGLPLAGAAYCASKAAMSVLGSTFAAELWEDGIRVSNICPGEVNTPIIDQRATPPPAEQRAQMLQAEDVAEAVMLIASLPPRAQVSQLVIKPTVQQFWV